MVTDMCRSMYTRLDDEDDDDDDDDDARNDEDNYGNDGDDDAHCAFCCPAINTWRPRLALWRLSKLVFSRRQLQQLVEQHYPPCSAHLPENSGPSSH